MAKSATKSANLILINTIEDAIAQQGDLLIATVADDEGIILGFTLLTKWLSDRPTLTVQKLIKDTGNGAIHTFTLMTGEAIDTAKSLIKPAKPAKVKAEKPAKVKAEKKPRAKKVVASGIERDASTEQGLIAKYGERIVEGSVRFETDGKYEGKRTVEIRCYKLLIAEEDGSGFDWGDEFSGETRRIATSDLFQVFGSEADHHEKRKADRRYAHKIRAAGLTK